MRLLYLYSRPGCHLCEQLEEQLYEQFEGQYELQWRDVDRQPEWRAAYGLRIPVLKGECGELLCETQFDAQKVQSYLARLC